MKKYIGVFILLAIVIIGAVIYMSGQGVPQVRLKGLVGGEKIGFLEDGEVQKILKTKYGITLDYGKAGSIEMVKEDTGDNDFLFPSSQTALEIFKTTKGKTMVTSSNIFNSPIVLYSWDLVVDQLIRQGIVQQIHSAYYIVDFPRMVDLIVAGKKWSDIGLTDLYGNISIVSTDPTKSNSGNQFAGLLANILNGGDVVDERSVETVLPKLKEVFAKLGYLEHSSSDLFEQYLRTGVGAKPIIVGYENQIIEFASDYADTWKQVKDRIRILYPVPTVWSAHPLIVISPAATELVRALEDEKLQTRAWEKHGFRTGLIGVQNDPKVLDIVGIPLSIDKVIPMPKPEVMERIIAALQEKQ